jgi:two-component system sensor histidine kinase YesM
VKKSRSTKQMLIVPTSLAFTFFIAGLVTTASVLYANNVSTNSDTQMLATSKQILTNYETYFDSVLTVSNNISSEYGSLETEAMASSLPSYFDTVMKLKGEIIDMAIYRTDGTVLAHDSGSSPSAVTANDGWFTEASSNRLINVFSRLEKTHNDYRFTLSKYIPYDKNSSYDAFMKVDFDFTKIVDLIPPSTLGTGGRFTIYDKNYDVVYTSDESLIEEEMNLIQGTVIGSSSVNLGSHAYYLYATTIANTTWRLAILQNRDAIKTSLLNFSLTISGIGIGVIVLYIVFLFYVANKTTKPIKELQDEMAKIESLNYEASLHPEISGSLEVVELNKSFNAMMGRMNELTKSIVKEKEEQRKSELKALQNQINPHFLYNTLDSIIALIDKGENGKAEEMILALSKFFRLSISKGKNIIPLSDEIEHARNYLLIQKMRFGESFSYDIEVEPGLEKYFVVKLILQPIVENSIGHGLKEEEPGVIRIRAYSEGDFIKFSIQDNGYGMTPEKVEELRLSLLDEKVYNGVGLKNVYQRLRIYYGEKANVEIASIEDEGTTVTIVIPKEGALHGEE